VGLGGLDWVNGIMSFLLSLLHIFGDLSTDIRMTNCWLFVSNCIRTRYLLVLPLSLWSR
jgi:hypothetical protein